MKLLGLLLRRNFLSIIPSTCSPLIIIKENQEQLWSLKFGFLMKKRVAACARAPCGNCERAYYCLEASNFLLGELIYCSFPRNRKHLWYSKISGSKSWSFRHSYLPIPFWNHVRRHWARGSCFGFLYLAD